MSIVMSLLVFTACSDDSVKDFSPVPYPDEMEQEEPTPDPTPDPDDPTPAPDADPVWKVTSTTTVFNSKVSTDVSYRVPAVAVTKAGTILVFCETRYGTWMDKGRTDILMKRSTDKGNTWTEKNITEQPAGSNNSYMDPTVLVDQTTGKIFLFTSLWDEPGNAVNNRAIMYTSEDVVYMDKERPHG